MQIYNSSLQSLSNIVLNRFSFVISTRGVVNHVYHPRGEDEEVVAIKKGLASIFASRLHEEGEVI
jgi:hypothetical protein